MSFDGELAARTPRPTLRSIVGVPLRLQTYRNLLYLSLAFPLGLTYFILLVVGLSLGVGLFITVIGVPILLAVLAMATGLASVERQLAVFLLGIDIEPPGDSPFSLADDRSFVERVKALVASTGTWKAVVYLVSKFFLGLASFFLITTLLVTAVTLLLVPLFYDHPLVSVGFVLDGPTTIHPALAYGWDGLFVGLETAIELTSWEVSTLPEALAVAVLGLGLVVVSLNVLNGLAWLSGHYARYMLGETGGREPDADEAA